MKHYTPQQREHIKECIINNITKIDEVLSVISIGSGAVGFTDELSDIDLYIVIKDDCDKPNFMLRIREQIHESFEVWQSLEMINRSLHVFLLANYLEIDIGYDHLRNVSARRKLWKIEVDKIGDIDNRMHASWNITSQFHGKTSNIDVKSRSEEISTDVWHYLMHCAIAIKRGKFWRALGEMELARNMAVELCGYRTNLETKRYRSVDDLQPIDLLKLNKSVTANP
ncbi:hypothetical protein [Paenibacillus durus]|uniref:Polymerase nucleotidyl transferase domain-containing protein n=1 Tax=Paenibacillus durus TaxID=44251 RepID=A0A089HSN8_PAEDU|nr:hypothetical protein [Paenibacillus durus]AIQ15026.1 hypothetical protein PDUR_26485 [Paenibacillus durus]